MSGSGEDDSSGNDGGRDSRNDDGDRSVDGTRLLCDVMLGSLATYCRMCGYDTTYASDRGIEADDRLLDLAREEGRTLLTRDRQLATRARTPDSSDENGRGRPNPDTEGLLLESREIEGQLRELRAAGYDLSLPVRPTRCGRCNAPLEAVAGDETTPEYVPSAAIEECWRCVACGQYFWKGSHWESVERTLAGL